MSGNEAIRRVSTLMRLNVFQDGKEIFEDTEVRFDFASQEHIHFIVRSQSDEGREYKVDVGKKWNEINCGCHFGVTHGRGPKTIMGGDTGGLCKHMVAVIHYISENAEALENLVEDAEKPGRESP